YYFPVMAAASLKPTTIFTSPAASHRSAATVDFSPISYRFSRISFSSYSRLPLGRSRIQLACYKKSVSELRIRSVPKLSLFAFNGESAEGRTDTQEKGPIPESSEEEEDEPQGNADSAAVSVESAAEEQVSVILDSLQIYKEALASNDLPKIAEIESFLQKIEDDKLDLEREVVSLTEELSSEKDRIIRISADFDNYRKRTERERASLVTNAQGEVVERLLQVLDNFERAKAQIKVETESEEKISNSYQSIYKQFVEILGSLGVVPVETVGKPFDPMLHEAIMREDSTAYEDGIVIEEYRKGFKLGDRLLRPSMVKVSSGPGPGKPEAND
ncbi:hypothetical protein M569_06295, partial [Genlisea aurea]